MSGGSTTDVPAIASNKDDLEIVNGTTWNENIVCTRDVVTTSDGFRGLMLQQPYGAIAQLPGWNAGFSVTSTHTIFNAFEFLNSPGQFYFDKTTGTLYYYPRSGENMTTGRRRSAGRGEAARYRWNIDDEPGQEHHRITFKGITFANTDYNLYDVANSRGKATVQGATLFAAYGNGDWHASRYEIIDTLPAMANVNSADSIEFVSNTFKHSGNEDRDDQRCRQLQDHRQQHHRYGRQWHHGGASPIRIFGRRRHPRQVRRWRRRDLHQRRHLQQLHP